MNEQEAGTRPDDAEHACDRCGRSDTVPCGDRWLCEECIAIAGSCCLEFGSDDLWQDAQEKPARNREAKTRNREHLAP